jgi:hypothetical protein
LTYRAACKRQRHAGSKVEADQEANVAEADAEVADEKRRNGGNALELEGHGRTHGEEKRKDAPPVRHAVSASSRRH